MKISGIKKENIFFFLPYGIFMFFAILSTSFYYQYFYGLKYTVILSVCFFFIVGGVVLDCRLKRKTVIELIFCLATYAILGYINGNFMSTVAFIPLFVYSARNVEFSKIGKFTIIVSLISIGIVIISSYLGIISNYVVYSSSGRVREFLGFRYALYPATFVFNITCLWLYLKREKIKWLELLFMLLLNYYVFDKTESRLSFYLAVILIGLFAINKMKPGIIINRKIIYTVLTMSFVICLCISIYLVFEYAKGSSWVYSVNDFFGNRIGYAYQSILRNGISIWGKKIEWNGYGLDAYGRVNEAVAMAYTYVDCMYINILQRYGVVITVIYLLVFTMVMIKERKKNNYYIILILSFYAAHCLIDDLAWYLYYNTFWFYIGTSLMSSFKIPKTQKSHNFLSWNDYK